MDRRRQEPGFRQLWHGGQEVLDGLRRRLYSRDMEQIQSEERRRKALAFWREHGLAACRDAYGVSRATLFEWQRKEREGSLAPASRAHRGGYAKRRIPAGLEAEIRRLRAEHPRLGKEKVAPLLGAWHAARGLPAPSESTVGRVMSAMAAAGRLDTGAKLRLSAATGRLLEKKPARRRKLRRDGYLPELPGDLLQVDGVTTFVDGARRYTFTAVDLVSRWAFARSYATNSSRNGADFLARLLAAAPFAVARIQTDNGSEFHAAFAAAAQAAGLVHFWNWPRSPRYQGWVERLNRTLQEEFLDWHRQELRDDLPGLNARLDAWLRWYNGERVHRALRAPGGRRLAPLVYLELRGSPV
jgi:putative transposase